MASTAVDARPGNLLDAVEAVDVARAEAQPAALGGKGQQRADVGVVRGEEEEEEQVDAEGGAGDGGGKGQQRADVPGIF